MWIKYGSFINFIIVSEMTDLTYPWISADTVDPDLSMIASTSSITSKYASLLVYLTPERRQGTLDSWPVGRVSLTLKTIIKFWRFDVIYAFFAEFNLVIHIWFSIWSWGTVGIRSPETSSYRAFTRRLTKQSWPFECRTFTLVTKWWPE